MKHTVFTTLLLTSSLGGVNYLQADVSDAQMRSLENRVGVLEQKKSSNSIITPPGRPQVRDGAEVFINTDWLIWQPRENDTAYAVKTKAVQPESSALYNSEEKQLHFKRDFGFRLGIGYNLPHDGWDLVANWTWFQDKAKGSITAGKGLLYSTDAFPIANPTIAGFGFSNAALRLKLNMVDLDLGREFFVSKWMTLHPFIGLRTAWIYQKLRTNHNEPSFTDDLPSIITSMLSKADNDYWGLGLHSGLNTQWGLGAGFSFFGNATISILNGFFQVRDYQMSKLSDGTHLDYINNHNSFRIGRMIAQLASGLRWETMFANDGCHFQIQAGWEQLMFFGQNQFSHFFGDSLTTAGNYFANQGDLSIQGLTLSTRFDF
ncbi:MAG: hypothetical protein K2Y01_09860 [Rhabdochlamydiaceae bacterium]|nr:hypothetical protein [Rhabdochlamydiaceae bacterium]